jgi:hypothetical protein
MNSSEIQDIFRFAEVRATMERLPGCARPDSRGRLSLHKIIVIAPFLIIFFFVSTLASAQILTGTVKDSTTGKPAAGDEVVLLSLGQGMEESGRTKADAKGNFSFKLENAQAPHLVRVIHQEVTYHRMAPPGTTSVEVEVYDVAKKIEGVSVVADVMRVQAQQGEMEVLRAFAVQNDSKPPRTQMNERNLEFYVPEGAKMLQAEATTANGNPLKISPVPVDDKKTRYAFFFPLRPGVTQFEVEYTIPYTGSANIDPKSIYPLQHFVAILPKGMKFAAAPGSNYQAMNDPQQPDANVQVASGAKDGQSLAFKISGEGLLQSRQENGGAPNEGGATASAENETRPGGGLGPPIDAPPPLQKYQWWILGGFAVALASGGVFVASRQQAARKNALHPGAEFDSEGDEDVLAGVSRSEGRGAAKSQPAATSTSSMLLEGLKDELFHLEVEHKQGRISQQEYESAKAALDQTLQRALKRVAQKV